MAESTISVIIPTYNRAHLLRRSVTSVLSQLQDDDEVIVVDDGSSDNTREVVAKYGQRVKLINTEHRGAGVARNRGVQEASRDLVAFLDSDDEWLPGHVLLFRSVMSSRPDLLFCFANYVARFRDGSTRHFGMESHRSPKPDWSEIVGPSRPLSSFMTIPAGYQDCPCFEGNNLYRSLCSASYVSVDTLMVRRQQAGDSLRFAEDTPTAEEWECGARLARAGTGAYLHRESACVHHHSGQQLTDTNLLEYVSSRIVIMRRVWGADPQFLREHMAYYEGRLREEQLLRAEGLLLRGHSREARLELAETKNAPLAHWLLARFPGPFVKGLLDFRRAIKTLFRRGG